MLRRSTAVALAAGVLVLQAPQVAGVSASGSGSAGAFHELNFHGLPNSAGIALSGVRHGDVRYILEVVGSSVVARSPLRHGDRLAGQNLIGLVLGLRLKNGAPAAIQFASIGSTTYWAGPSDSVPTYRLTYTSQTHTEPQPLCSTEPNEAILFSGDRYDADRNSVVATGSATEGWFNIACAGTALAKLHLTRHTEASQIVKTTAVERQAMLKMLTADICGDGTSFTVHGQPLMWADGNRLMTFSQTPASLESVWNEHGAVCLDVPRRPGQAAAIAARCGPLPPCTNQRGYVISANPM